MTQERYLDTTRSVNREAAGEVLIIFAKNFVPGRVKTRLAATIGNDRALAIYKALVRHTRSITDRLPCKKVVYQSDFIEDAIWGNGLEKRVQNGNDLGHRMMNAFEELFQQNHTKVVIIGTDCPELNKEIITLAFEQLNHYDVVIGPATDGGYYLLGTTKFEPALFKNIAWSTKVVLDQTIAACLSLDLRYYLLQELSDLDNEDDLKKMEQHIAFLRTPVL